MLEVAHRGDDFLKESKRPVPQVEDSCLEESASRGQNPVQDLAGVAAFARAPHDSTREQIGALVAEVITWWECCFPSHLNLLAGRS